jgi:hypothetical protein
MSILKNSPTGSGLWSRGNDVHHHDAAPASASLSCASVSSAAISSATAMGMKLGIRDVALVLPVPLGDYDQLQFQACQWAHRERPALAQARSQAINSRSFQ